MTHPSNGSLYHKSGLLYEKGDVIVRGHYGRLVRGWGGLNPEGFLNEYVFERIRQQLHPNKPSRMSSAFVFESYSFAEKWTRSSDGSRAREYVYLVRLEEPSCSFHRGDISWISQVRGVRTFDGIDDIARKYWEGIGREIDSWEIIVDSNLVVLDRLTKIYENGTG